jgi:hypothetical protein
MRELLPTSRLAPVLVGQTQAQREKCLVAYQGSGMLCLPYREPRYDWFAELVLEELPWKRIHLLGMSTLKELLIWVDWDRALRQQGKTIRFSVDTSKPVKAGLLGHRIDQLQTLRGLPISSKDLLGMSATPAQLRLILMNISFLRSGLNKNV